MKIFKVREWLAMSPVERQAEIRKAMNKVGVFKK